MSEGREGKAELAAFLPVSEEMQKFYELSDNKLDILQAYMMCMPERMDCPLVHRFTPSLYVREMTAKAGTVVITKIHKKQHPFTISSGRVVVWHDDEAKEICAPYTGITQPGTRRAVLVLEDVVWTTYHVTSETNLDKIEDELITPHEIPVELLDKVRARLQIGDGDSK